MDQDKENKTAEFYERLKVELDMSNTWPAMYLFKFIVPSIGDNIERVENAFNCMGAVIKTTKSKTGKFTSISIDVQMKDAQEIIDKYIEVSVIEGIVSL
jgi:putative lipoic acid-binding regulatory protein